MKLIINWFLQKNAARIFRQRNFCYHTSLNIWDEELSTAIKFKIENHWKEIVQQGYDRQNKDKYYVLSMFPYPSGNLHMGHVRVYTISDTMARFHRLNGKNVLHPMGWDAFGLPAENAALDKGHSPALWTVENIKSMKRQLEQLACNFDWEREVTTCQSNYYRWTQYIFLKLLEHGLVYRKEAYVNWDPVDKTVLADEQVDINGCSWRSGAKVEKKMLHQWFIRTTAFAKQLFDGLSDPSLEDWKDIINIQKHWIGECNGVTVDFKVTNGEFSTTLCVWTDKPEVFMHGSFICVQPESILDQDSLVDERASSFKRLNVIAHNPITGAALPIFVTSELQYPEGADSYLAAPKIFDYDREFATNLNVQYSPENIGSQVDIERLRDKICNIAKEKRVGGYNVSSKLKDWLISRQRFWGTPIPVVHCENCGIVPLTYSHLPVVLPSMSTQPLSQQPDWLSMPCPQCTGPAKRETDTMDTFVDSSWYYLRYLDAANEKQPFDPSVVKNLMPVDLYIGGKEHAVLHLYYARFMCHFLESIGLVPTREPFKRLLVQGMVMGKSYKLKTTGKYLHPSEVLETSEKKGKTKATCISSSEEVITDWEKMSKSKHNGVIPEEVIKEYGCDTMRLFMLADFAPTSERKWSSATFPGVLNWQRKMWMSVAHFIKFRNKFLEEELTQSNDDQKIKEQEEIVREKRNYFTSSITFSYYYTQQHSVCISRLQELTAVLRRAPLKQVIYGKQFELALAALIIMLAPMAPHFACELWAGLQSAKHRLNPNSESIWWDKEVLQQRWPCLDPDYHLTIKFKVNGAEIGQTKLPQAELNTLTEEKAFKIAMMDERVKNRIRYDIKHSIFHCYPGCRADINIIEKKKAELNAENDSQMQNTFSV